MPPPTARRSWRSSASRSPRPTRFVHAIYRAVGLRSFFTVGEDEVRAWTIRAGDDAVTAAGEDPHRPRQGLRARGGLSPTTTLVAAGGMKELKAKNGLRLEPKDYVVEGRRHRPHPQRRVDAGRSPSRSSRRGTRCCGGTRSTRTRRGSAPARDRGRRDRRRVDVRRRRRRRRRARRSRGAAARGRLRRRHGRARPHGGRPHARGARARRGDAARRRTRPRGASSSRRSARARARARRDPAPPGAPPPRRDGAREPRGHRARRRSARSGGARVFLLPGPPREMRAMFEEHVAPALARAAAGSSETAARVVWTAGVPESDGRGARSRT